MMKSMLAILAATFIWDFGLATPLVRYAMIALIGTQLILSGPSVIRDLIKPPRFL
jgi:hypothetical protein